MLFRLIPSKAALYAAFAAFGAAFISWVRLDAKRNQRRNAQIKDYKNAADIETRVTDSRSDPDRMREYDGTGYRD